MQNLFGIIDSQSRYELQTRFLFNPYKLQTNTTNRYGAVDSGDKISKIENVVNDFGDFPFVRQDTVSSQPNLVSNAFGSLNGVSGGSSIWIESQQDITRFKPDKFTEFWIAFKIYVETNDGRTFGVIFDAIETNLNSGFIDCYASNSSTLVFRIIMDSTSGSPRKGKIISVPISIDTEYDIVWHVKGTDDANDWDVYINESLTTTTVSRNDSFVGFTLFPNNNPYIVRILNSLSDIGSWFNGKVGKLLGGYGSPNVKSIQKSLNSTQ